MTTDLIVEKVIKPAWIKKAIRNNKARERYFIKKYGDLEMMYALDRRKSDKLDEVVFQDEQRQAWELNKKHDHYINSQSKK